MVLPTPTPLSAIGSLTTTDDGSSCDGSAPSSTTNGYGPSAGALKPTTNGVTVCPGSTSPSGASAHQLVAEAASTPGTSAARGRSST